MKKFFTQPKKNASVRPTSDEAAQLLCAGIDRTQIHTIGELGPGTGPVTQQIKRLMHKDAKYWAIEYEEDFMSILRKKFSDPRMRFVQGNVNDILSLMQTHAMPIPDLLISTLPNQVFEQYPHLVQIIKNFLDQGMIFRAITYAPDIFLDIYKDIPIAVIGHTWKNVPPVYVLGA